MFRGALRAPALAPFSGVSGWDGRLDNRTPVEHDVGVLRFERAPYDRIERLAAHFDVGRRAKPVEHARPDLAATVRRRVHEGEAFDAALVPRESQKRQRLLLFLFGGGLLGRGG